jgi:hypothetical protein
MAVEAKRGCGYRKVGGLYMVGTGAGIACDRLPIPLEICRCCGQGIKQTRGWTWVDIAGLVGGDHMVNMTPEELGHEPENGYRATARSCDCAQFCPLCHNVASMGRGGLLWIGVQFYPTVAHFEAEASRLGISRRITSLPRGFEIGKSWVLFAHAQGTTKPGEDGLTIKYVPAIFRVWKPERIERIYKESDRGSEAVQADEKRGISPVFVPDGDKDHQGTCYDKEETESPNPAKPTLDFGQ